MSKHIRDFQRSKVYYAQRVFHEKMKGKVKFIGYESSILFWDKYFKKLLNSKFIKNNYPTIERIEVIESKNGPNTSSFMSWGGIIGLNYLNKEEPVALHEFAHTMTYHMNGFDTPGHGKEFCECFLDLVKYRLGKKAAELLEETFKECEVKFA